MSKGNTTTVIVCDECNSSNVETLCWVNANSNKVISSGGNETEDNWCNECAAHTNLIEQQQDIIITHEE